MNKRFLFSIALLVTMAPIVTAKEAPARIMHKDSSHDDVLIIEYRKGNILYKMKKNDLNKTRWNIEKLDSIYFYEPPIYKEAMSLYQGRKYAEAKEKFIQCQKDYKSVDTAPNNYATLAGFYSLECSRRQLDLATLSEDQMKYRKDGLMRETQIQQLEVNAFWEAVRLKNWARLDRLAQSWEARKVTGSQRAQISYCHGLALEQLAKEDPKLQSKALNAYNRVLSADFTASTEIVIKAANNALRMYKSDPKLQLAMKLWETEDENKATTGYQYLLEANTLVKLYKQAGLDAVKPLSDEYNVFLKYEAPKQ